MTWLHDAALFVLGLVSLIFGAVGFLKMKKADKAIQQVQEEKVDEILKQVEIDTLEMGPVGLVDLANRLYPDDGSNDGQPK